MTSTAAYASPYAADDQTYDAATVSPFEANFLSADWLEQTRALMTEPEMRGWYVPMPDPLRARADSGCMGYGRRFPNALRAN